MRWVECWPSSILSSSKATYHNNAGLAENDREVQDAKKQYVVFRDMTLSCKYNSRQRCWTEETGGRPWARKLGFVESDKSTSLEKAMKRCVAMSSVSMPFDVPCKADLEWLASHRLCTAEIPLQMVMQCTNTYFQRSLDYHFDVSR